MKVIIFGCGRTGSTLALLLSNAGHDVTIIEQNPEELRRLGPSHRVQAIIGSGLDEDVLLNAGIEKADAFVAATQGDNRNLMAAQMVQEKWQVPKVCAKTNDAIRGESFKRLGVFTVTPNALTAGLMRDWLTGQEPRNIDEYNRLYEELLL